MPITLSRKNTWCNRNLSRMYPHQGNIQRLCKICRQSVLHNIHTLFTAEERYSNFNNIAADDS